MYPAEGGVGVLTPGTEVPERLEVLRVALTGPGHGFVAATPTATNQYWPSTTPPCWTTWRTPTRVGRCGFPEDPGQDRVVGYLFPTPGFCPGLRYWHTPPQPRAPTIPRTGLGRRGTATTPVDLWSA